MKGAFYNGFAGCVPTSFLMEAKGLTLPYMFYCICLPHVIFHRSNSDAHCFTMFRHSILPLSTSFARFSTSRRLSSVKFRLKLFDAGKVAL